MTDDLLSEAVQALREETAEKSAATELTRARIMASVRERRRRRAGWVTVLVPLAAVLVVGTALATATGRLPNVWQRLVSGPGHVEQDEPSVPKASFPSASSVADPEPEVVPEPVSEPKVTESSTARAATSKPVPPRSSAPIAGGNKDVAPSDTDPQELYRAAHRAHFQQRDHAEAIRGYERYLSVASRGRFATEASYNRALCLARVGRSSEAVAALRPFAEGRYGGYRRTEANALIEAMTEADATSPPPIEPQ